MSKKIKVIFFHPYFKDGGVEKTNIRIAKIFINWGLKVSFVSLEFKSPFIDEVKSLGIEIIKLKSRRTIYSLLELNKLIKYEMEKFDKLVIIGCQNFANLTLVLTKLFY